MPAVDICLSPTLLTHYNLTGKAVVVIDILRATTTMVTGIAHGIDHFVAVATLDECSAYKAKGYLTAAERDGLKADGFDLGNSPLALVDGSLAGQKIAITTTNGTMALTASQQAQEILVAGFVNVTAAALYLKQIGLDTVLVCSGWKGHISAEDTLFAGVLAQKLQANGFLATSDACHLGLTYAAAANGSIKAFMANCSHITRLSGLGIGEDINFCLEADKYDLIVKQVDGKLVKG